MALRAQSSRREVPTTPFWPVLLDTDPGTPYEERFRGARFYVPNYSDAPWSFDLGRILDRNDHQPSDWLELVQAVSEDAANREAALQDWIERKRPRAEPQRARTPAKALRSSLIQDALTAGKSRPQVCEFLDLHGIPTTPDMIRAGILKWREASEDKKFRQNIQTMISKEAKKR